MKPRFRYYRDSHRRPLVTECILYDDQDQPISGGLAICSPRDNPCKATGRKIALQRAQFGRKLLGPALDINREDVLIILDLVDEILSLPAYKAWRC